MTAPCATCGSGFEGTFCPHCGERRLDEARYSIRHFAEEAVEAAASLDGRLLRTLRTLLLSPGLLTAEYFHGRRVPYLRPLQLFLICNVAFFFAQGWSDSRVLNTPLQVHTHSTGHQRLAHRWVHGGPHVEGEKPGPRYEPFRARFDAAVEGQSRVLVIVMVPMLAGLLALLFVRRRRYLVEHLVFATHFYAFMLLVTPLLVAAIVWTMRMLARGGVQVGWFNDGALALPIMAVWGIYLALATRRFYGDRVAGALVRGAVLSVGIMQVLFFYRVLLFFTAYAAARWG